MYVHMYIYTMIIYPFLPVFGWDCMTKVLQDVPGFIQMRSRSGGRVHQQVQRCLARNNARRATLFRKCRELAAEMPEIYFRYGHI